MDVENPHPQFLDPYLNLAAQLLVPLMRPGMTAWDVDNAIQLADFVAAELMVAHDYGRPIDAPDRTPSDPGGVI